MAWTGSVWRADRDTKDPGGRGSGFRAPSSLGRHHQVGRTGACLRTKEAARPTNTGQFVAAIRVSAFAEPAAFGRAADAVFDQMHASAPLPGHDPVRIPGERRETTRQERMAAGIPLHRNLRAEFAGIAGELGIPPLPSTSGGH